MNQEFRTVLLDHIRRYPLMTPQDCVKLAYQNALGPEHAAPNPEQFLHALTAEWAAVPTGSTAPASESIGNGLCRFHLSGAYSPDEAAPLLTELFVRTCHEHTGSMAALEDRLAVLEAIEIPDMEHWLADYRAQGCPSVHHSPAFRDAYRPHYRVIRTAYADYFPVFLILWKLLRQKRPITIAIDGRCGSGKTCLAAWIKKLFPCNVFHMDDFYLPISERPANWEQIPGGNMDFTRFRSEVLLPVLTGKTVFYRPFSCQSGQVGKTCRMEFQPLTVIEGSYSHHPVLNIRYDLKIFLTCSKDEQARRLLRREGDFFRAFETRWIPMEERYFETCQTVSHSDFILDTSSFSSQ